MTKQFNCQLCERAFATFGALKQHHVATHPGAPGLKPPPSLPEHESEADRIIDRMIFGRWS